MGAMQGVDVVVAVEFPLDAEHAKAWKGLGGIVLEQRLSLPALLLAEGNLLELELDGSPRELRIEVVRWVQARQTVQLHVVPTEAAALAALGLGAWRPWLRRRAREAFLERCRDSGWRLRGDVEAKVAGAVPAPVKERIEPTL